jgi:hypothetical protein
MPDFDLISTTLADRYAPAQVTPPTGLANIRGSTADTPNQLGPLPYVLVLPVEGEFETGNGTRVGAHDFLVRFFFSQADDLSRDIAALRKWLTVLVDQLRTSTQLGGFVTVARTESWRLGMLNWGGQDFTGIEMTVRIVTSEGWAASA